MAAKLVIIKQVRSTLDVPFFCLNDEQKQLLKDAGTVASIGERLFARGFKKLRTLFFPTVELYDAWEANETIQALTAARAAYNTEKGITERKIVIDLPGYTL